jgi:CRISPR/Cas system CSM-associated protein Csm3 (group 7 of RAMP superfamily)
MTELRHKSNRYIIKRIIVRGTLVLDTPTSLGSGDADSPTDLPLLRDSISNHALLTGSSIAGALRNYLRERKKGYQESDRRYDLAAQLFGDLFAYKDEKDKTEKEKIKLREQDTQSLLIIDDAIGTKPIKAELRDGVKINGATGTAEDKAKYDLELLQAGTEFPLSFELLVEREANEADLLKGLAIALSGLEKGEISLGMKKRRGFGRCKVHNWQVWNFNLEHTSDRMAWLTLNHSWLTDPPCSKPPAVDASIVEAMKKAGLGIAEDWEDKRDRFLIYAQFQLVGSLLIRSGQDSTGRAPDVVHLKSHRPDKSDSLPVLSGTSLAGVLRHRAERIVNTLGGSSTLVKELFGFVEGKEAKSSRLVVHEKVIEKASELVQNRIAIDRFTGGAYHGALFEEQPIFGGDETLVTIELELRKPEGYEIGLLLLLLKDLWTSDLPVGGESSIGRGRLKGIKANLIHHHPQNPQQWEISEENGTLHVTDKADKGGSGESVRDTLEGFVKALLAHLGKEVEV